MMKNNFYFTSKVLFVPKILKFLSRLFGPSSNRVLWIEARHAVHPSVLVELSLETLHGVRGQCVTVPNFLT